MARDGQAGSVGRVLIHDIELEVLRCGSGRPLLLLHGMQNLDPASPFLGLLGERFEIIAPSHPGFGGSRRPDGFETMYDLVRLHFSLMDALHLRDVTLMGLSFGGWIAAEMAVAGNHRLDRLILADAFGIKVSDRETPDILDIFNTHPDTVKQKTWHNSARAPDLDAASDEALVVRAQNWNALCLYGWNPYMHNPRLKRWLKRVNVPTLVLWGESDGVVTPSYGRTYSELIPSAEFSTIPEAGHHPEIERPEAFAERVLKFLDKKREG